MSLVKRVQARTRDTGYHTDIFAGRKFPALKKSTIAGKSLRKKIAKSLRSMMFQHMDRTNHHTGAPIKKGDSKRFAKGV